jgi:hypothetical protein
MFKNVKFKTIVKFQYLLILSVIMLINVSCGLKVPAQNNSRPMPAKFKDAMPKVDQPYIVGLDSVPFSKIDQVPLYPGCETLKTPLEQKRCTSQKVLNHINTNFNTDIGKKYKLKGMNKIIVHFEFDKDGNIANVKASASHPKLEEEALRVINSLPEMIPGEHDGKKVGVGFSLPIVFEIYE